MTRWLLATTCSCSSKVVKSSIRKGINTLQVNFVNASIANEANVPLIFKIFPEARERKNKFMMLFDLPKLFLMLKLFVANFHIGIVISIASTRDFAEIFLKMLS